MIDLSYTRAMLLAQIEATDSAGEPLSDITDPRVAMADGRVHVCGHGRGDLFPLLKAALLERFAAVPRPQLIRDLLIPLRNALGNAYKHGNGTNPAKKVSVEIVLTRKGVLLAVSDEGTGFDVALTFRRFQEQQTYFESQGVGFRNLHRAMSTVSYENGGRTVLLCFRSHSPSSSDGEGARGRGGARAVAPRPSLLPLGWGGGQGERSKAFDPKWIQTSLSAELPEFGNGQARLESCRVYATCGLADDQCGNRYVLRVASHRGRTAETRILTGRLHATDAAAETDFQNAMRLREAKISNRLRIPRPVRLSEEPRLVLYDFDPWINLWEYLTYRRNLKSLQHSTERIGEALAGLHRSQAALRGMEPDPVGKRIQAVIAEAEAMLRTLPDGSRLVKRLGVWAERIQQRAPLTRQRILAPIHGAFGWDCILYGVDRRFYLFRFETCRWSEPGLDLGGFAADLLRFTLANHDEGAYRICLDSFLSSYNSQAEHPISEDELRFYLAGALVERLVRAQPPASADVAQLFSALGVALWHRGRVAASELSS